MEHNHPKNKKSTDYLLLAASLLSIGSYLIYFFLKTKIPFNGYLADYLSTNYSTLNQMIIGIIVGIFSVFLLSFVPNSVIDKVFLTNSKNPLWGIIIAVFLGFILDACDHGVLIFAVGLYKRGVKVSQIVAFLIATPWNSLSITFIMIGLFGLNITLLFIVASIVIAILTGLVFEYLIKINFIQNNKVTSSILAENSHCHIKKTSILHRFLDTLEDSKSVVKWILVGTLIASIMDSFIPTSVFAKYFGANLIGLMFTLLVATLLEICSEGSLPIAFQIYNSTKALGNAFTFLMTGVSTNYTQFLVLKEATGSYRISILIMLISTPQIIILGQLMNIYIH